MRRRWVVSVAVVSMALTSVVSTAPVTVGATGSARTIPHWDASAARERAASRDVLRADSLQRLGASLPEVTWSPVTVSDPTNDPGPNYNDGQSDLTGMRLASTTEPGVPSLFMSVNVVSFAPPWNQSWTDNASYIDWVIDRNNDNRADFVAEFSVFNGLLFGDVYNLNVLTLAGKPSHACNAIPVFNGTYGLPGSFGVYLPWSCIGNPASVKVFARMDIPAFGAVSQDDVPDTTWVSVSSRIRPNAPATPSTVSAPASLDVTWPAPTSSVWPVTDYVVQYSATSPVSWKTFADGVSTARSARVTGLTAGKSYIVRVATKNKLGMSAFSAPSAARRALAAGVVPTAAGRPGGVPGAGKVTVAWALPAKAGSHPITDYQIEYSLNGGTTWVRLADAVTTVRSAVVSGLTPLSRIVVRVRAKSFAGVGPWSATSLALAPFTVPSAPRSFAATPGNGSLGLSWIAPSAIGGGAIDRYRVYYRPAPLVAPAAPRSTTEIVNGSETTITTAPWQVRLRVNLGGGGFGLCGGSLVDPQWVLTAAHCVQGQASTSMLVHGGITRQSEMNSLNGVTVDKVMIHASYNALTEENDIALLHLTKPTKGTPIKLFTDTTGPALATPATISGWGRLSSGGSVLPDALQTAAVKVQAAPGSACGSYGADFVPALMLCAGDSNLSGVIDTCQGDSGGPLVITVLGVPRLAGVTSFGQGCATVGFPGVYTRVSTYVRWIQDRVESTWPYVDVMCSNPCLSKVLTGLTNDAPTEVKVRAHTQYGFGAFSPVLTATPTAQPPGAPTALTASGDNTSVTLTWAAPLTDGGSPLTKYQYSEDGATWVDVALPATTVTFAPVSSAPSTVTFRVRAVNAKGDGAIATFDLPI